MFDFLRQNRFKVFPYLRVCKSEDDIIEALQEIEVERKNISIADIKELGEFEGKVKCYKGVFADIKVTVTAAE